MNKNPLALWRRLTPRGKIFSALALVVVLAVVWFAVTRGIDMIRGNQYDKKDAALEKQIKSDLKEADSHGANANTARDKRQVLDQQAQEAQQRRQAAGVESNKAADRQRAAQQAYEKTLNSRPSDYNDPPLTDDELCARLAKLDPPIPCHQ